MAQPTFPLTADARERFLLEIAAVVPRDRIAEVHFFPPMRQGQLETGVAVVAAMPEGASLPVAAGQGSDDFPLGAKISSRHVVYSARYRWTRKGPERGKWDCEVVAEADAPLLTVEAVVQGVLRRADEPTEVQKVEGETLRQMILEAERRWQTSP